MLNACIFLQYKVMGEHSGYRNLPSAGRPKKRSSFPWRKLLRSKWDPIPASHYPGSIFINVYVVLFLFNNVICVFLLLGLCILIVCLCMATLTEVSPCFFLSCKAKCQGKTRSGGARPALFLIFVLFYILFVLCRSMYCLCVNVYCTTATGWLPNWN
jgi:hypothetical protein